MSDFRTMAVARPITNDEEARDRYRVILERAGFERQVAEDVAEDVISAAADASNDAASAR